MKERDFFGFFQLGCNWVDLCRQNILFFDFHEGNLIFDEDGIKIVDIDDAKILEFPKEIEQFARGVIGLFINFGKEYGAAFRYGVCCEAGRIGQVMFDILYDKHGLTVVKSKCETSEKQLTVSTEKLIREYANWNKIIEDSFIRKMTDGKYEYDVFSYIELMQKNEYAYQTFKRTYGANSEAINHECQVYFANGLSSGNDFDVISSALTMSQIAFNNDKLFISVYYLFAAHEKKVQNEKLFVSFDEIESFMATLIASKIGKDSFNNLMDYVTHETFRLRIERGLKNPYYEIWYWEDFSKEHSFDDYIMERQYGYYVCDDCNNVGSFDGILDICDSCGSSRVKKISTHDYIRLQVSNLTSLQNEDAVNHKEEINDYSYSKIEDMSTELPVLDSLAICVRRIIESEKKGHIQTAIELACSVESFLKNHPELFDEDGFVIEKPRTGGQIFYDLFDPTMLVKLFLDENEHVRNDYEGFICHVLCKLYKQNNDMENAVKYAKKTISLADSSRRWLFHVYVKEAYKTLSDYYQDNGDAQNALKYANIVFNYYILNTGEHILKETENHEVIDPFLTSIMSLGNINASAGNLSLAYSCFTFALRMHIYHHGCRHPDTAVIYHSIALLLVSKKLFEEAWAFWGVALLLLKDMKATRFIQQKADIEKAILASLEESRSQMTLSEWKDKNMTPIAFSVFPEKNFEKASKEEIHTREMSPWDLKKRLVVYNA